jgi:cytochrome P450
VLGVQIEEDLAMTEPFALNPFDEVTRRNPYALYQRGRDEHPVFRHSGLPLASVFRHEDVLSVLKDDRTWGNRFPERAARLREVFGGDAEKIMEEMPPVMLQQEGEEHARLRGLVNQAFTPRLVRQRMARMKSIAEELLDEALEKGEVDLVQALTYPLPVRIIAEIIGIPGEDAALFKDWSDRLISGNGGNQFGPPSREAMEEQLELIRELHTYFVPLAEKRRHDPRDDLLSGLVAAEHEGSRLTHPEMLQMLVLLLVAGNETTTTLIGNMAVTLLEHRDELSRLRADPALLPTAVDEILRFSSPVQGTTRRAAKSARIADLEFAPGEMAILWIASANRDERVFPQADRLDVGRRDNRHLAFGFGRHFCLGANLSRLEAQVAFGTLLARTRDFELTSEEPLPLHPNFIFRSFTRIPVRLEAA